MAAPTRTTIDASPEGWPPNADEKEIVSITGITPPRAPSLTTTGPTVDVSSLVVGHETGPVGPQVLSTAIPDHAAGQ
ncbi:hypothetical protein, partial [Streptomyces luteogriseus]|uniref:hypothetical protein n=1 Tax=Streptomyces luteogriseus TaxID=68233 RepID=UPI003798A06A